MIGKRFRSLPFIFANDNYTLRESGGAGKHKKRISVTEILFQAMRKRRLELPQDKTPTRT